MMAVKSIIYIYRFYLTSWFAYLFISSVEYVVLFWCGYNTANLYFAVMHDLRLIHTDLKPENILLVSSEYIKVPDYKVLTTLFHF